MKIVSHKSGSGFNRRKFLANTSALGAASFLSFPRTVAAEPPPETKKIRFVHVPAICLAPQYLAEELLRQKGFSEVDMSKFRRRHTKAVADGRADITQKRGSGPCCGPGRRSGR